MKKFLLSSLLCMATWASIAQQPEIQGDVMLCPESEGTAFVANDMAYDSYQWYVDFYPHDTFEPLAGETGTSFTYDAFNYSIAKIKVVATLDGTSYHSNELLIDSMVFLPISYSTDTQGGAYFDPNQQVYVICENGDGVINTVMNPYNDVQWYKDGVAIPGATSQEYIITVPGVYYAIASPQGCPNFQQITLESVVVECTQNDPSPVIGGDVMLCPDTNGTAGTVTNIAYDTYQWYADFYPYGEFELIEGATAASFTYDWYNYDQAKLKLVVTLDGETYESNIIQIDSYNWSGMIVIGDVTEDVTFDDQTEVWVLCEGAGFVNTVNSPYTENIQWFKDGVAIDGATESSYTITEAGSYTVVASPDVCPDNSSESLPIVVTMQNCKMGIENPAENTFAIYPNPASDLLTLTNAEGFTHYTIFDMTGKRLTNGSLENTSVIDVSAFENGTYLLQLSGDKTQASRLFIKL